MAGLSHRRHSGSFLQHHHTSYGALGVLLVFGVLATALATASLSQSTRAGVVGQTGAISVGTLVTSPPPTTAPTITSPRAGSAVTGSQVTVTGTCAAGMLVAIWGNGSVLGSALCTDKGAFSLIVSLPIGATQLTGYHYDAAGQSGPASVPITVTYRSSVASATAVAKKAGEKTPAVSATVAPSFGIMAPYRLPYIQPNDVFMLTGSLANGSAPYALQVDWGDGQQSLLSRAAAGTFAVNHTYDTPGNYAIKISATDGAGTITFYQTALVVSGATTASGPVPATPQSTLYGPYIAWPLLGILVLTTASFWLGEHYDRKRLQTSSAI